MKIIFGVLVTVLAGFTLLIALAAESATEARAEEAKKPPAVVTYAIIRVEGGYRVAWCSSEVFKTPAETGKRIEASRAQWLKRGVALEVLMPSLCPCEDCQCGAKCPCAGILRAGPAGKANLGVAVSERLKLLEKQTVIPKKSVVPVPVPDPDKKLRKEEK